jgi:hypothetical protein
MTKTYKLLITLDPEDLHKLDALVRQSQTYTNRTIITRVAVIRDLIRDAYSRGTHEPPQSQSR